MKKNLFRKETIEKITGPEELNTYVKVLGPRTWLILVGIAISIVGLIIFVAATGYPVGALLYGNMDGLQPTR